MSTPAVAVPTETTSPAPASTPTAVAVAAAALQTLGTATVHGPYEDAIIALLKTVDTITAQIPPADQKAIWDSVTPIIVGAFNAAQNVATKIDFLHLFMKAS